MKKITLLVLSVLLLCTICIAQAAEKERPVFTSARDIFDSMEGDIANRACEDYIVLILEMDNRYIRMVTLLDDHAKDLYKAIEADDYSISAMEAFNEYALRLPLSYAEEIPEAPKSQAELDELMGRTVQELQDEGFGEMILSGNISEVPVAIDLEYGFYKYEFEVTNGASGYPQFMSIKSENSTDSPATRLKLTIGKNFLTRNSAVFRKKRILDSVSSEVVRSGKFSRCDGTISVMEIACQVDTFL